MILRLGRCVACYIPVQAWFASSLRQQLCGVYRIIGWLEGTSGFRSRSKAIGKVAQWHIRWGFGVPNGNAAGASPDCAMLGNRENKLWGFKRSGLALAGPVGCGSRLGVAQILAAALRLGPGISPSWTDCQGAKSQTRARMRKVLTTPQGMTQALLYHRPTPALESSGACLLGHVDLPDLLSTKHRPGNKTSVRFSAQATGKAGVGVS